MSLNPGQEQASTNKNHLPHLNSLTFQNFLASRQARIDIFNVSSLEMVSSQQEDKAQEKRTKYTVCIIPDILLYLGACSWQFSACHIAWPFHQAAVNIGKIEFTLNERPQAISNQAVCALHPMINEPGDICRSVHCHSSATSAAVGLSHTPDWKVHLIFRSDLVVPQDGEYFRSNECNVNVTSSRAVPIASNPGTWE